MNDYAQTYRKNLEAGLAFQDFVTDLLYEAGIPVVAHQSRTKQYTGENKAGIEIKLDRRLAETGNLFIEYQEKANPGNPNYVDSGIFRKDNTWLYAIGDYSVVYVFQKNLLRWAWELKSKRSGDFIYIRKEIGTSKGFLVPRKKAEKWAAKILRPKQNGKQLNS